MTDLLTWSRAQLPEMVALLRALVEIESPSTEPAAVAALAARVSPELAAVDLAPAAGAALGHDGARESLEPAPAAVLRVCTMDAPAAPYRGASRPGVRRGAG